MMDYLILFAIVLAVNLMPAFGPPTWSVIVIYSLNTKIPTPALILTAALGAATGRLLLAYAFRWLSRYASEKTKKNVAAAREVFERKKRNAILAIGLFALSPVPSAPLFEAAGLARVPLLGFTAAFFVGRTVSYTAYLLTASAIERTTFGKTIRQSISSPFEIILQVAMVALVIGFTRVDWAKLLRNGSKP